ncbi:ankyrin repeat-containing domain protein [Apiosordaria backusii]|uniref:Ankyrin repeat-containing domain protein n=1 Tax=Apiosordaria backusii TaxID=314023 RepID=A0AA40BDX9_9PEZI|nr:ankyrin repeat-containing domain protein [Apiosordaria backusii]
MGVRQPISLARYKDDRDSESTATPSSQGSDRYRRNVATDLDEYEKPTKEELFRLLQALAHKAPFTELKHQLEDISDRLEIRIADVLLRSEFVWHERAKFGIEAESQEPVLRTRWTSYGTLLHEAVHENEFDLVKYLLSPFIFDNQTKRRLFLEQRDYNGMTALLLAITVGNNKRVVEYLVDQGANITAADNCGWTAMHYAMQKNRLDIAKLLHEKDEKLINIPADSTGDTPVHIAIRKGEVDAIKYMTKNMAPDWFKLNDLGLDPYDLAQLVVEDGETLRYLRAKVQRGIDDWDRKKEQAREAFEKKSAMKQYYQILDLPKGKGFHQVDVDEMGATWGDVTDVTYI